MQTTTLIQNTMSAYCRYIDTKQWESLSEVLTEQVQAVFKNVAGEIMASFNSPAELVKSCEQSIEKAATIHHLHNAEFLSVTQEQAEVIWAMEDRWYLNEVNENGFQYFHGYGYYQVNFIFQSGKWLINKFVLIRLKVDTR